MQTTDTDELLRGAIGDHVDEIGARGTLPDGAGNEGFGFGGCGGSRRKHVSCYGWGE